MKYQAILFDMDGTLLPMDQERFVTHYFRELSAVLSPLGMEPKAVIDAVWAGTKAMVQNDGTKTNREVFWACYGAISGQDVAKYEAYSDSFYTNEFHRARPSTGENPLAAEAVRLAHEKSPIVVLATNPLFPMAGQLTRMSWMGLKQEDFDWITAYENERFCKPNPRYYEEICARLGVDPSQCLMIGNDEKEDMYAASLTGMDGYLITDCLLPSEEHPWKGPRGTFAQMVEMLRKL